MRKTILTLSFLAAFLLWSAPAVFAGALFPFTGVNGVVLAPPAATWPSTDGGTLGAQGVVVSPPALPAQPGASFMLNHAFYNVTRVGAAPIIINWNARRRFTVPAGAGLTSVLTAGSVPITLPAGGGGTFSVIASILGIPGGVALVPPATTSPAFTTPLVGGVTAWLVSAGSPALAPATYILELKGKVVWTDSAIGSVLSVGVPAGGGTSNYIARAGDAVPEPCTMLLLGTGLAGFAGRYLRRRKDVVHS